MIQKSHWLETKNMAPKKKGKSAKKGKMAKMTEEERILYLEQKELAEKEMQKKKEDMLNQFLKVRFEIVYSPLFIYIFFSRWFILC